MDVLEEGSVLNQLNSFPLCTSWFPYGFDWNSAVADGFYRGNGGWIVEQCPGIVENFVIPAMYSAGLIVEG